MPIIKLHTFIKAKPERVFDLARNIDAHQNSVEHTHEVAIAGKTSGLLELNETVTWRAKHFGITQELTVKMTQLEKPHFFEDRMIKGAFSFMNHKHFFFEKESGTEMIDEFEFRAPFGFIGKFFEALVLTRYMRNFLLTRNAHLKIIAEQT